MQVSAIDYYRVLMIGKKNMEVLPLALTHRIGLMYNKRSFEGNSFRSKLEEKETSLIPELGFFG